MAESVIVTGGRGFVGHWLVQELGREVPAWHVTTWDLPDIDITKGDSYEGSLKALQPTWIVHLAAISVVSKSYEDPTLTHRVNVEATQHLLNAVTCLSPATKVLAVSSADIYGSSEFTAQGTPPPSLKLRRAGLPELSLEQAHPLSPYAKSKWEMERIIEERFNDRVIRARPFPHIGPGQARGFVTADFASQIAAIESQKQPPVVRVGNLEAARDFTDVRDVVRAYRLLLQHGSVGEVYHVASGTAVTIQSILDRLLALSRVPIQVEQDPDKLRPSDVPVLVGDASKLTIATGWQPTIPLDQTLQDILTWWREQS